MSAQQARSVGDLTRQDIIQLIPQFEIMPLFRRQHLNREVVIGTIGDRGGGKSATDSVIGIVDYMLAGIDVCSNMVISCDIEIDSEAAEQYGLMGGGVAHYRSLPLDKNALLQLDDTYRDKCLVIEEINVQFANARRAMANTNVEFNEVCQQLRKFKTSLVYNVIDEMFVDVQLRTLTDIMIQTYDTAFDMDALINKKPTGLDFKWQIYALSGYLKGEQGKYRRTKRWDPAYFHFGPWQGVFDTTKHQEKGVYSMSRNMKAKTSIESSPEMQAFMEEYGDILNYLKELYAIGIHTIKRHDLFDKLEVAPEDENRMHKFLKTYCNLTYDHNNAKYIFPERIFGEKAARTHAKV